MRTTFVETGGGTVALTRMRDTGGPVVALMYGAFRRPDVLQPLMNRLEGADLVIVHQPGHNGAPMLDSVGIAPFATAVAIALQTVFSARDVVFVGESLGGLIGLAVGRLNVGCLRSVIALDPFFTTAKLWPVQMMDDPAAPVVGGEELMREVFGLSEGVIEDRDYRWVMGRLRVPAFVVTGDLELFPKRSLSRIPCLMDATDRVMVEASGARLVRLEGGHLLAEENAPACVELINLALSLAHDENHAAAACGVG